MNLRDKQEKNGTTSGRPAWNDTVRYGNKRKYESKLKVRERRGVRLDGKRQLREIQNTEM